MSISSANESARPTFLSEPPPPPPAAVKLDGVPGLVEPLSERRFHELIATLRQPAYARLLRQAILDIVAATLLDIAADQAEQTYRDLFSEWSLTDEQQEMG